MPENTTVWMGVGININEGDDGFDEFFELARGVNGSLSKEDFLPHINLYDFDFPWKNIDEIDSVIRKISEQARPFEVPFSEVNYFKHGTIYVGCEMSKQLRDLQETIVKGLNNFREGVVTKDYWQPRREYNQEQIRNREIYGNPHVLDTFFPHVTIGYLKNMEKIGEVCDTLNKLFKRDGFMFDRLDLVAHDNLGKEIKNVRYYNK